jgi:hypothetical protein
MLELAAIFSFSKKLKVFGSFLGKFTYDDHYLREISLLSV